MKNISGFLLGLLSLCLVADLFGGVLDRQINQTLALPLNLPHRDFTTEDAFGLSFNLPLGIVAPPGETDRLFILEKPGRILVITNLAEPTKTEFLNISSRTLSQGEEGLLGLAFHPDYKNNRQFFVFYTTSTTTDAGSGRHDRLSRFLIDPDNPDRALPDSEVPLITQYDGASNHNGGDLHFGDDGYLYVALGDEGGGNDDHFNSQRIDKDFFAGMLRIDIDKRPGSLAPNPHPAVSEEYAVPPDNPWVGATEFLGSPVNPNEVRTEFYAVGLRNPWRFSFDRPTGRLYVGDVGQSAREEIDIIEKGGNYGWAFREGNIAGPKWNQAPEGFEGMDPILDYQRNSRRPEFDGNSVTGGVVYRGSRFPELYGNYVFADYGSGNIWAFLYNGETVSNWRRIANDGGIAGFGVDPRNGDVLLADISQGRIKRLVSSGTGSGDPLPETLSETGAFTDLETLTPAEGIVPYQINLPFWSDLAEKQRWFMIPGEQTIGFSPLEPWSLPSGSIWVKHFELQLTNGVPESARRLETRFIVRNDARVYGITYRWNDEQTEATLVDETGRDETFVIYDEQGGIVRTQTWHYPSRSECTQCHTEAGGFVLGFNTAQLNRTMDYPAGTENQLVALSEAGYVDASIRHPHLFRTFPTPEQSNYSREFRVRSWLAVNCSQCHQPDGPAPSAFDTRASTPTSKTGIIHGMLANQRGNPENRVVTPGNPGNSELLQRIQSLDEHHMPPIDSNLVDTNAVSLITTWIEEDLPNRQSFEAFQLAHFGSTEAPEAQPGADPEPDGAINRLEWLLGLNPLAVDPWRLDAEPSDQGQLQGQLTLRFHHAANRIFQVETASDVTRTDAWELLPADGNRPFPAADSFQAEITTSMDEATERYYRVRVIEP